MSVLKTFATLVIGRIISVESSTSIDGVVDGIHTQCV